MSNEIEIPIQCLEDKSYSDCPDFNAETDGCEDCEFIREDPVGCIGGQIGIIGYARSCEKGYWKDDI